MEFYNIANKKMPVPEKVWQDWRYFIAFGFGSGAMPFAPGTFGTLMSIPFYLFLAYYLPADVYVIFVLSFILFSCFLSDSLSRETQTHDHPGMCIDEFAGFFVTMCYAPFGLPWVVLGFLLFRFFDIVKIWPINVIDKSWQSGFGMIFDDVLAGIYSMIVLQIIAFIGHSFVHTPVMPA